MRLIKKFDKKLNNIFKKIININKRYNIKAKRKINTIIDKTINSNKSWNIITYKKLNCVADKKSKIPMNKIIII